VQLLVCFLEAHNPLLELLGRCDVLSAVSMGLPSCSELFLEGLVLFLEHDALLVELDRPLISRLGIKLVIVELRP
jgi:hypothetical protein